MAKESLKIGKNGQWSVNPVAGDVKPMKVPLAEAADPAEAQKLKALAAKLAAIKSLKSKRPDIDWESKLKQSLEEMNDLAKSLLEKHNGGNKIAPYDVAGNAKRKQNNAGSQTALELGPNRNPKQYGDRNAVGIGDTDPVKAAHWDAYDAAHSEAIKAGKSEDEAKSLAHKAGSEAGIKAAAEFKIKAAAAAAARIQAKEARAARAQVKANPAAAKSAAVAAALNAAKAAEAPAAPTPAFIRRPRKLSASRPEMQDLLKAISGCLEEFNKNDEPATLRPLKKWEAATKCQGCGKNIIYLKKDKPTKNCLPCHRKKIASEVKERKETKAGWNSVKYKAENKEARARKLIALHLKHPELTGPIPGEEKEDKSLPRQDEPYDPNNKDND